MHRLWRKVVRRMDLQTEQAVWRRVKGPGAAAAEEALLPERLEALILQEQADAAVLRTLARRMGGQGSAVLSRVASGSEARARELTTLHYLLSGRRLRLKAPPAVIKGPLSANLRQTCLRMEQTAKAYGCLEKEFSDRAELFSRFARQAREQSRSLMTQLQKTISNPQ